jgi:proteasome lid subunit RPN8/RPN11
MDRSMVDKPPEGDPLRLSREQADQIGGQVQAGMPHEVCGLLGGVGREVREVHPVPNAASNPATAYLLDPSTQLAVMLSLERRGLDLVAIYHSHPPGAMTGPSPSDIAQATYPGVVYLIVVPAPGGEEITMRGFLLERGSPPIEVPIMVAAQ